MRRAALLGILLLVSCDGKPSTPAGTTTAPGPTEAPVPAGFGTITGVVRVKGSDLAPVTKKIAGQEEHCGAGPLDLGIWRVEAASRGLADVHVLVEGAKGAWGPSSIPTLDNGKCVFRPAVLLMAPGDLKIANSDTIPHSAVFNTMLNPGENVLLPEGASRLTTLRIAERIEVTCSVHPWMHAVVIVKKTPFESLTKEDGSFELRGVPAGKHRLRVWHRCVGEVDVGEVEVPVDGTATVTVDVAPLAGFRGRFK